MSQTRDSAMATVLNATRETFDQEVFQRSKEVPVVVDFWAEWCSPCRVLGPVLEKLAGEYNGRFMLVKANTDQLREAALLFRVQSIPAVFGVLDGEIADFFQGALPERQVRAWLDQFLLGADLIAAKKRETSDPAAAEAGYRRVLDQRPNEAAAQIGLARVVFAQDRREDARQILSQLEARGFLEPEAEKIKAALELSERQGADVEACRARAAAQPENLELQLELAQALAGQQRYQEALQLCLALVERDRQGVGETARREMVDIFRVLPEGSELAQTFRRKLAAALY